MILEPPNEVRLQEVGQIAFTVPNLAEAKSFYKDVLELEVLIRRRHHGFFNVGL